MAQAFTLFPLFFFPLAFHWAIISYAFLGLGLGLFGLCLLFVRGLCVSEVQYMHLGNVVFLCYWNFSLCDCVCSAYVRCAVVIFV